MIATIGGGEGNQARRPAHTPEAWWRGPCRVQRFTSPSTELHTISRKIFHPWIVDMAIGNWRNIFVVPGTPRSARPPIRDGFGETFAISLGPDLRWVLADVHVSLSGYLVGR